MSIRKSDDLANDSDSRYNNLRDATKRAKITERFDDTTHNEQPSDEALQFLNKKLDECIDALNTNSSKTGITTSQASAITANTSKTGITTSQANAITANTAKVGTTSTERSRITANHAKVSYDKNLSNTNDIDLKATITDDRRGNYTILFTMTVGETIKTATLELS